MNPILPRVTVRSGEVAHNVVAIAEDWPVGRVLFTEKTCGDAFVIHDGGLVFGCVAEGFGGYGFIQERERWTTAPAGLVVTNCVAYWNPVNSND